MRISFVIPSYNCAAFLPHAVKSCQDQTHKNIEIVIIDDCSTDTTNEYIDWLLKQHDERIVYKRNEKNMGRSYCRNLGNKISTGDAICVLDSDDLAVIQRAEWTAAKMRKHPVCYGSAIVMDAIGKHLNEIVASPLNISNSIKPLANWKENLEKGIVEVRENGIVHSSMAYTKEIANKYHYADGRISDLGIDDWEMQIRMMKDGISFGVIPDVVCFYRNHGSGISKTRNPLDVMKLKAEILEGSKCGI